MNTSFYDDNDNDDHDDHDDETLQILLKKQVQSGKRNFRNQ